ncbi:hypothetical protein GGF39_003748 [Coemansia sp. RSA 1721]|nr:hypothetical protein GGF39_003748 [Coemansia sp. RSA 1721]
MRDFQHRELQRIRALASGVGGTKARSSVAARRLCGGCGVRPGGRGRRASLVWARSEGVAGVRRWCASLEGAVCVRGQSFRLAACPTVAARSPFIAARPPALAARPCLCPLPCRIGPAAGVWLCGVTPARPIVPRPFWRCTHMPPPATCMRNGFSETRRSHSPTPTPRPGSKGLSKDK